MTIKEALFLVVCLGAGWWAGYSAGRGDRGDREASNAEAELSRLRKLSELRAKSDELGRVPEDA